ncbi:MAG TPA: NAD(+) diphosphatase, partial [Paracoccaceae bacterium]|nr:NAD(+) diphosphatase [Paracoccaceae bacterium]
SEMRRVTFAAGNGQLDRAAHLRDESEDLLHHPRATLLPLWQERMLFDLRATEPRLGWVPPLPEYLADAADRPVFLGMTGDTPCFAADVSPLDEEAAKDRFGGAAKFIDLRSIAGELDPDSAAIAATAKGVLGWHRTHRFCSRCGAASRVENGGWRRRCPSCAGLHFPRTDPVVIMLVLHGDSVLVGRQSGFPPGVVSLLAGFMEPGETIEDAVRRETREETTVEVGRVGYLGCQPWPFPSNLMLGCIGEAVTTDITIDPAELEDAQWVSRAEMQVILEGRHPHINPPRKDAIARAILTDWVNGGVSGF